MTFEGRIPVPVTSRSLDDAGSAPAADSGVTRALPTAPRRSGTLVGTIVHRLIQHRADVSQSDRDLAAFARRLCRAEELVDVSDVESLMTDAAGRYRALVRREDLAALFASSDVYHEVPYSYFPPDRPAEVVRGVIDCVVLAGSQVVAFEFKTGLPRPDHEAQAGAYAQALRALWPDRPVEVRILYP
jgi:ATP-dependent exoDNAse (exonuclease V) beta subunit